MRFAVSALMLVCACPAFGQEATAWRHLATNGLPQLLASLPLSDEALSADAIAEVARTSPGAREVLKYLVECALPEDAVVTADPSDPALVFHGRYGLASSWADGPCDVACQEWVSACLFARSNTYGVTVQIYMSADHPGIGLGLDDASPVEEGAFYGNWFMDPPQAYSCRGEGYDPLMMSFRVCSQPGSDAACTIQHVGACGAVDGDTGRPAERSACEPPAGGAYRVCHNRARPVAGAWPEPSRTFTRVLTVRLQRSGFSPGCGETPWDPDAAVPPDPFVANTCNAEDPRTCAGERCVNDDGCRSDVLTCAIGGPEAAFCTARCQEGSRDAEEAQCGGPGTTCVTLGGVEDGPNFCTRACDPTAAPGEPLGCAEAQVCTGLWFSQDGGVPDDPGCVSLCRTDADCYPGFGCNARTLACGVAPDPAALPDGTLCTPAALGEPNPCRGQCLVLGSDPAEGICGSFVRQGADPPCPDGDNVTFTKGTKDDIALCLYHPCSKNLDCAPPLTCKAVVGLTKGCAP